MSIGIAFAQGFLDRSIQTREEDRRSKYQELLRQRDLDDWKTKETFSNDMALNKEETLAQRTKTRADRDKEEQRVRRIKSFTDLGYDPKTVEALSSTGMEDGQIVSTLPMFESDGSGGVRLKTDGIRKKKMDYVTNFISKAGWQGTKAEEQLLNLAQTSDNPIGEFLKDFEVSNGGQTITAIPLAAARVRADGSGSGDKGIKSWHNNALENSFSDVAFSPLTKLLKGAIQQVKIKDPETGQEIRVLKAQDTPGFYEWKSKIMEQASILLASGKTLNPQTAIVQAYNQMGEFSLPTAATTTDTTRTTTNPTKQTTTTTTPEASVGPTSGERKQVETQFRQFEVLNDAAVAKLAKEEIVPIVQQMMAIDPARATKLLQRYDSLGGGTVPTTKEGTPMDEKDKRSLLAKIENMETLPEKDLRRIPQGDFNAFVETLKAIDPDRAQRLIDKRKGK